MPPHRIAADTGASLKQQPKRHNDDESDDDDDECAKEASVKREGHADDDEKSPDDQGCVSNSRKRFKHTVSSESDEEGNDARLKTEHDESEWQQQTLDERQAVDAHPADNENQVRVPDEAPSCSKHSD